MQTTSRTTRLITGILLTLTLACGAAAAEENDPGYLVEFRAYNDALERNDVAAAALHSYKAWQNAEKALGNHRLTAVLAYNHGFLVIFSDRPSARLALDRVADLRELAKKDVDAFELAVYRAYLDFADDTGKRRVAGILRDTLRDSISTGVPGNSVLAAIWLELASADLTAGRHSRAIECANHAETILRSIDSEDYRSLAKAKLINGAALLLEDPADLSAGLAAHLEFQSARNLFPLQEDIDSFDPILAQVMAWDAAAGSARKSMGRDDYAPHSHEGSNGHHGDGTLFDRGLEPGYCGTVEWAVRTPPIYPRDALRDHSVGAVLVGFNIAEDLTVEDARILAEVPSERFSWPVLSAVRSWRARPLSNDSAACRKNQVAKVTFAIGS